MPYVSIIRRSLYRDRAAPSSTHVSRDPLAYPRLYFRFFATAAPNFVKILFQSFGSAVPTSEASMQHLESLDKDKMSNATSRKREWEDWWERIIDENEAARGKGWCGDGDEVDKVVQNVKEMHDRLALAEASILNCAGLAE